MPSSLWLRGKKTLCETQLYGDVMWIQVSVWHNENIPIMQLKHADAGMDPGFHRPHQSLHSWGPGHIAKPMKYYYSHAMLSLYFTTDQWIKLSGKLKLKLTESTYKLYRL